MNTTVQARKDYRIMWIKYAGFYAVMLLSGFLIEQFIGGRFGDAPWFTVVMTVVTDYVIAFPVLILLTRRDSKAAPKKNKMSFGGLFAAFAISMLFSVVGTIIGAPINLLVSKVFNSGSGSLGTISGMINSESQLWSIINISVIAVIGPVVEELIFRKILIDRVCRYGEITAILASGIAFGLFHGDLSQVIYTACMGFVLAYVYVRSGNILYTIGIHIAINLVSVIGSLLSRGIDVQTLMQEAASNGGNVSIGIPSTVFGFFRILIYIAGLVLFISVLAKKKIQIKPASEQVPKGKGGAAFGNIGFILYAGIIIAYIAYRLI